MLFPARVPGWSVCLKRAPSRLAGEPPSRPSSDVSPHCPWPREEALFCPPELGVGRPRSPAGASVHMPVSRVQSQGAAKESGARDSAPWPSLRRRLCPPAGRVLGSSRRLPAMHNGCFSIEMEFPGFRRRKSRVKQANEAASLCPCGTSPLMGPGPFPHVAASFAGTRKCWKPPGRVPGPRHETPQEL